MNRSLTEYMVRHMSDVRWWMLGVITLVFVVVAKTSTVGAPVQARSSDAILHRDVQRPPLPRAPRTGPTFDPVRTGDGRLLSEVEDLRARLAIERRRSAMLAKSVEELTDRVDRLVELAPSDDELPAVPVPSEAIYVRPRR